MPEAHIKNNQIFWIDVDTIFPNPYQPRHEFDEDALRDLSDSIRQYGVMQPITVTEAGKALDGRNKYELIAGERRLRASKMAGVQKIPAVVRMGDDDKARFELAIIENLQREDLNPIERARAFQRLIDEFGLAHAQIGKKMGKSREYVSNTLRLLSLPPEIMDGLAKRKISEGHTRPLMMLSDRPDEQMTLFKEIVYKKMSVRESERIARKIAQDRVRKDKHRQDPQLASMEQEFSETLGTRVSIEKGEHGGKIVIDYFSAEDLEEILKVIRSGDGAGDAHALLTRFDTHHKEQEKEEDHIVAVSGHLVTASVLQAREITAPTPVSSQSFVVPLQRVQQQNSFSVPPSPKHYIPYSPKDETATSAPAPSFAVPQALEITAPTHVTAPLYDTYTVPPPPRVEAPKARPAMRFDNPSSPSASSSFSI